MIQERTKTFWKTTVALSIGSLLIFANVYFTQPLLPVFTKEFHISPLVSGMSVTLVILALGISLFFYGPLSDSIGRRGIMIITMGLGTAATFAAAFSPNFETLLMIRILQGIFFAGLPSIAIAYIGEEYSASALSLAIGIYISGNTIGGMFGRTFSGILTDFYNWRIAFITMGFISLLCLIAFILLLRPSQHFKTKPFYWKKSLTDYKSHLKNKELRLAYFIGGFHFFIFVGQFNYVTYLLSSPPFNLPTSIVGLLFLTYIAGTISSPTAGKLSNRLSKPVCIEIGILIMVVGFLITLMQNLLAIIIGLLLICFGFFFAHSIASSWVSSRANYAKASASGLYLIFYYIGGSLGPFYLEPFWSMLAWKGIVIGCLLVLAVTSYFAYGMKKLNRDEEKALNNSVSRNLK